MYLAISHYRYVATSVLASVYVVQKIVSLDGRTYGVHLQKSGIQKHLFNR